MGWTEQQIQSLKKMWGNGFSANDIAKSLGGNLTRNAVIGKAHRLKLSSSPISARADSALPAQGAASMMAAVTKIAKKRVMLRPLPPVQMPENIGARASIVREAPRPIEAKRVEGIAVTKAGERHCRWPIGDPRSPDFRFCGCASHDSLPYCADHARMAYQTVSRKPRGGDGEGSSEFRLPSTGRY